jgi:hypothetical protein
MKGWIYQTWSKQVWYKLNYGGLLSADGKNDIGYNFLIGQDGVIYEGRGWGVVWQHTDGNNLMYIGQILICLC